MTSKESFDNLHEIESRLKEWETLEERDEMEKEREPYYIKYSDVCNENNHSIENTINKLVEVWNENTGA